VSHLICADLNLDNAEETAKQARDIGQSHSLKSAIAFKVDVSKEQDLKSLFESAKALQGRIDICVNTAGVSSFRRMPVSIYVLTTARPVWRWDCNTYQ
jgi:NAD(P)-dependent dehydrogenase (short-subunit alcohol dehydrogenase family)